MVSPSQNAYSETFINAQKNGLKGAVFYYYGGVLPLYLENYGTLLNRTILIKSKVKRILGLTTYNAHETAFVNSLKKNKIDLVFAQYGETANRIVKICQKLNIPLITHFHGYDASIKTVLSNCKNYKEVFGYSSFVISVSKEMQKRLLELGCPEWKLVYNVYGPDSIFLSIKPDFTEQKFVGIGRFVDKKSPYYTILAFSKVLVKYPHAKLVIGGNGVLYDTCVNLVNHLNIENNVSLPGVMSRKEFIGHLSSSIAFVQHSVTALSGDQEGTPVAVLEASAAGLPIIATKHAGIPDVIIDGETGLLVEEHDVDAMAEKMMMVLENKELAEQLGRNGKERIKTHFTIEKHLRTIDDLIENIIKKK